MKKILLVNNQEAFLDRNKSLLNRAGFLILTASTASEALQISREQRVDLICSLIRQDSELRNVSIILVCYQSEEEQASNCGANAVVTKPVRPEQLLKLVEKFLGIRARREYRAALHARVEGTRGSLEFSGVTRNISASGMLCESDLPLNKGDLLRNLSFIIDAGRIDTDGKVVWYAVLPDEKYGYGVQFIGLASELREKIEQFVAAAEQE